MSSVTPNESSSPSIIDTMTEHRIITESSTQSLINENLTQPITTLSEMMSNKVEETTLELGSEENIISVSHEETSSAETEVSEEETDEEEEEDNENIEETTHETQPIDTDEEDETTMRFGKDILVTGVVGFVVDLGNLSWKN